MSDYRFFPGTVATVSSILVNDLLSVIYVIVNENEPLLARQYDAFSGNDRIRVVSSHVFGRDALHINAWELKAYAASRLSDEFDVLIGIDSDCVLCSSIDDVIARAWQMGGFAGGQDGHGARYDDSFEPYGISVPTFNDKYMSTSLFACACTPENRRLLERWANCCNSAMFNGTGPHPGHGDQGVLNAVLFAGGAYDRVELLDNRLWSQHWTFWDSVIEFRNGEFWNLSAGNQRQRSFHCGGAEKFWTWEHRQRVAYCNTQKTAPYLWFLAMLWFGACRNPQVDLSLYLPAESQHLARDLVEFFPQIVQVYPQARTEWKNLPEHMIHDLFGSSPSRQASTPEYLLV